MADDAKSIDRNSARLVNEGYGREANKLIYHDGYYYLVFSEHRDGVGRYVMAKRDRKMTGKFEEECQLLLPCRDANEPNQGGIIEGPSSSDKSGGAAWYFLTHHGSGDWSGRIVSLLPVEWLDGWPMIGDTRGGLPGTMVWQSALPFQSLSVREGRYRIERSDDFDNEQGLSSQWQWNYQPREDMYSLTERPGWLRLKAFLPLETDNSQMAEGQHAGLCHFAQHSGCLGVVREGGHTCLELRQDDRAERGEHIESQYLWLRSIWGLDGWSHFYYSIDGDTFTHMGNYNLSWGFYRGDRIGIYNYNNVSEKGFIDVDYLHYEMEK